MAPIIPFLALAAVALSGTNAHPGHSVAREAAERANWLQTRQPKSVRSCTNNLRRRGQLDAALVRRQQLANKIRAKRGIVSRSLSQYNVSHASDLDVTLGDDEMLLFSDNSSCVLQPEVTQGPYYIDGELIRYDMSEDQDGIPLYLDVQLVDTSTCEPVTAVYVDAWHCNATGVYSGVVANGNGNSNDSSNLDATFLRGLQQTDANGVVQFETVFPGHYTGRTTHIHILAHQVNATTIRTNRTLLAGNFTTSASHVGQIFFDDDLITAIDAVEPYSDNTQTRTTNADDSILASEAATDGSDPFVQYLQVNPDDISDGLIAWISVGIDPTADRTTSSAGTLYEDGGVANDNSMGGPSGGGGGGGGMGPMSSGATGGAVPTGTPPARK